MPARGYAIYKVQYNLGLQDPLIPGIRYHTVVFVETGTDGGGYIQSSIMLPATSSLKIE
jgi:hypothetical protein